MLPRRVKQRVQVDSGFVVSNLAQGKSERHGSILLEFSALASLYNSALKVLLFKESELAESTHEQSRGRCASFVFCRLGLEVVRGTE